MPIVIDAPGAWLVKVLADAGVRRLPRLVLGTEQERALRGVAATAIHLTAQEHGAEGGKRTEELARVVDQVFRGPLPEGLQQMQGTLLEELKAGIEKQLAVLDDADLTGTGVSSSELLGVSGATLAATLTNYLLQVIKLSGSHGGPLNDAGRTGIRFLQTVQYQEFLDSLEAVVDAYAST